MLTKSINFSFVHFAIYCSSIFEVKRRLRRSNSTFDMFLSDIPFWYLRFESFWPARPREWGTNIERTLWRNVKMRKSILFEILNTNICALITCFWNDNKLTKRKKNSDTKRQNQAERNSLVHSLARSHMYALLNGNKGKRRRRRKKNLNRMKRRKGSMSKCPRLNRIKYAPMVKYDDCHTVFFSATSTF